MTESSRSKTIEVMARALYEANHPAGSCWSAWDALNASERGCYLDLAAAALTAYESHLQAEGMAVVGWRFDMENAPKGDCLRFEPAEYRRGQLSLVERTVISNGAYPRKAVAWMPLPDTPASPYGKAVVKEEDDE